MFLESEWSEISFIRILPHGLVAFFTFVARLGGDFQTIWPAKSNSIRAFLVKSPQHAVTNDLQLQYFSSIGNTSNDSVAHLKVVDTYEFIFYQANKKQ